MKEDYLKTIKEAGFNEINIIEETTFPLQYASNDPTVKTIMNKSKTSITELNTLTNSIASIKLSAIRK